MSYPNAVCFNIPTNDFYEKTVFVSLVPNKELEFGQSGSVYAVLTDSVGTIVARDLIPNMRFAPAHDPNYIVQRPVCLELPKKEHPITYTVHFQNTGGGSATKVKVVVHLPKGMNWSAFNSSRDILDATFAGQDHKGTIIVTPKAADNQLEIEFTANPGHLLKGTNVSNPAINPETMGEVTFTIKSTPGTDDKMEAYAQIYFLSEYPSSGIPGQYEDPVRTNIAVTTYKKTCKTCTNCPLPCYKILWFCWWWWLVILVAIILLLIIIIRRRKKKQQPGY